MHSRQRCFCSMHSDSRGEMRTGSRMVRTVRRLLVAMCTASVLVMAACGGGNVDPNADPVRVVVPNGSSFRAAAESLASAGVVDNPRMFRLYAKFRGQDRSLKPGTYEFRPGTEWREVLDVLSEGRSLRASITIPEGWELGRIVPLVARQLEVPEDSVVAAVRDTVYLQSLGIPAVSVEGYVFPATYQFPLGTTAREAVETMLSEFERRWKPEWNALADSLGMSRHEVVTLASIVEKEARVADERTTISAVYHNRLRIGMALQADPTVQYARGSHTSRVLFRDLEIDSPYNTYRYPGLPPGPIASPGSASLEAALNPADVNYLYFVARPDGRHEFRRTFEEHASVAREMRRLRDSG